MNPEQWSQISDLFHRGLPLSDLERDRLIADEVQDPDLEAHLRQLWEHADPTGFLERPLFQISHEGAVESTRTLADRETELAREAVPNRESMGRVGKYRIVSVLGEGGMGVVYLGMQDKPIYRQVAIKVIKSGMNRREVLARFEAERQTLALMDHPNIAQIHEADVGADGRPYFVMEYVQGIPITEYCDRNLLGCRDRLLLFQQVCHAVQHAHQRGIIHRDLKPSNILIAVRDGQPVPKVIDFGVAKAINQRLREEAAFTEFGMLVGTPEYMSPEQAEHSADVDTTSDVYSLGVMLYELLAGALPFDSKTLRRAGLGEIQRVIREEEPPRPTRRLSSLGESGAEVARKRRSDLSSLLRQLRGDLDWIVMKALEKDRTRRYNSASEFAADIGRNLSDEPVLAGPPSAAYQLKKFARRHRLEFAAAALLLIVLLGALAVSTLLYFRAERARIVAESQAYKASLAAARSSIDEFHAAEARETLLTVPASLRKWEWKYLYWLSDTSLAVLNAGEGGFNSRIGFSADGSVLFVSTATSVHTWKIGSFLRIGDYGPFGRILSMSHDGALVAAEVRNREFRGLEIVETLTSKRVARLPDSAYPFVDASFSVDGSHLAAVARDGNVRAWEVIAGRLLLTTRLLAQPAHRTDGWDHEVIAMSPDGSRIAVSEYKNIRLWDVTSRRSLAVLAGHKGPVQSLSFGDHGHRLISVCESVNVWNPDTGELVTTWVPQPTRALAQVAANPATSAIAVAGWHAGIHLLNDLGQQLGTVVTPSTYATTALSWSPRGEYIAAVDLHGVVRVWQTDTVGGQVLRRAQEDPDTATFSAYAYTRSNKNFNTMALSTDGSRMFLATGADIEVLEADSGNRLGLWKSDSSSPVRVLAVKPGTDTVASGSEERLIKIWKLGLGIPVRRLEGHQGSVTALAYSPDGTLLVSGSDDQTVRFWSADTGVFHFSQKLPGKVWSLAFSPNSRIVAVGLNSASYVSTESNLALLDVRTGQLLPALENVQDYKTLGAMRTLAFSPNGEWLVASDGGLLGAALWDVRTGKQVRKLSATGRQGYGARSFTFSPDSKRLVSSYGDGSIGIWDPEKGELLMQIFENTAQQVQFAPDNTRLYVNALNAIRVLDTRPAYPPEAEELISSLQQQFPLVCDLRNVLRQSDKGPRLRDAALRLTEGRPESPLVVQKLVDAVINSPSSSHEAYETALRRSATMAGAYPWDQSSLVRLGAALYRTQQYKDSLATLERVKPLEPITELRKQIFLAMACYRQGSTARARELLAATRLTLKRTTLPNQFAEPLAKLHREAESLIAHVL